MKRMFRWIKNKAIDMWSLDIRNYISAALLSFSFFLMFKRYSASLLRFFSSIWDLFTSLLHYGAFILKRFFERFFGFSPTVNATVNEIPEIDLQQFISFDLESIKRKIGALSDMIFDPITFIDYNEFVAVNLRRYALIGSLLIPALMILIYVYKDSLLKTNDKPAGSYSRLYSVFCKLLKTSLPRILVVIDYIKGLWKNKKTRYAFGIVWAINLNMATIIVSAVAYYFYFVSSFNIFSLFRQIVRLFIDLVIMLSGAPFIFWLVAFVVIFIHFALKRGYRELEHMESKNCGFLKTIDYLFLIIGPPGAGKTSLLIDIGLSFNNIFKQMALDIMMAMEMLFPAFSFSALRRHLDERIKSREIDRLPRSDLYIDHMEDVYNRTPAPTVIYNYDKDLFAYDRDTGTDLIDIFSAMRTYARAYFIYNNVNNTISAIPVRLDGKFDDSKHLKKWNGDFFKRSMRESMKDSTYAHIFDEDIFRAGKKMDEDNPYNGTLGYGIWLKPELGKSHGNQFETEDVRKDDDEVNEKNDLYHWQLKMPRHALSVVYNQVFFRYGADEQRAEDVPAKIRQLMTVIQIADKSEVKLALPFGEKLDKFYEKRYKSFVDFYEDYLNARSDMVLSVMLYKFAIAGLYNLYWWFYNTFGYTELTLELEKGSTYGESDSEKRKHVYYYMFKKGRAKRYSTDSHSPFYAKEQLAASVGMIDLPTFKSLQMSDDEIDQLHDFFFERLKNSNRVAREQEERDAAHKVKQYSYSNKKKDPSAKNEGLSNNMKCNRF